MNIVITGASRGIGAEFVRRYLDIGATVHAVSRNTDRLAPVARENKNLKLHAIDLESERGPAELAKALGGATIDLLINNAGIYLDHDSDFSHLSPEKIRKSFEVNTLLPMRATAALLPQLIAAKGTVANISSLMGSVSDNSSGGAYAYRMSKAALNMFTKSFSVDYPKLKTVALHPGWVKTDMGGENATTTVEESVKGLMKIIAELKATKSGHFYDFEGDELHW
ncbi:MAG: SDR family oxidoreductase [Cryobacterium sp.]|nr:SDR family oxidoreductase [Oligoflexia bacterium]